jgi:hypothetical protein
MAEEAGEALGKVKRSMRGEGLDKTGYLLELGDCLAYLTMAAHEEKWTLKDILNARVIVKGNDLVRCSHQLIIRTEGVLDKVLDYRNHYRLRYAMSQTFMQLKWNSSHPTVGSNIEEVMQMNINKLTDRKSRNVLRGSGDKR